MEKWNGVRRTARMIYAPSIQNDTYLQLSEISKSIQRNSHFAKGILLDVGAGIAPYKRFFINKVDEYVQLDNFDFSDGKPDIFGEGTSLPIKSNSVDTVFSSQVLEHVPNPQKMVDEIYRVLKPGGICILSTHMANPLHGEPHDYFRFTKYAMREVFKKFNKIENLEENGGALLSITQFVIWGLSEKLPKIISNVLVPFLNSRIPKLDKKFYDVRFTTNYVIVARK